MRSFCRKTHVRKIPPFWGGFWGGGGGSADFIFMGARIFLNKKHADFVVSQANIAGFSQNVFLAFPVISDQANVFSHR